MLYFMRGGASAVSTTYKFGEFRLDCGSYELLRGGRPVKLERKPMELLLLFTSRQGELVTRAEIAERLWSSEIFVDTEHGINTAIRKLRMELRDDPAEPKFIKTVTGMGYRFVAPVVAEAGPEEARLENPVPEKTGREKPELENRGFEDTGPGSFGVEARTPFAVPEASTTGEAAIPHLPVPHARSRPRFWVRAASLALVLSCLLVGLLAVKAWQRSSAPAIHSIAVIPLDNFSGDAGQEYLADGMTDELVTMIARNSTLRVTSRTSMMQYKGAHRPLSEIAHALGVDGIVEGSIARKGDHVHMTLQLIRADTDSHVWAQSFDRETSDTALAEEAAREIAKQLRSSTPAAAAQRYINPAAHDAYLRGKYLWFSDNLEESGKYFQKATEIQPDYAAAWAGLADYYGEAVAGDALDPRIALPKEEAAAKRALELGPDLAEAHVAMAAAYLIARWDWVNAEIESQRALSLDPHDAELWYFESCVLSAMNRKAEAIEAAKKSVELSPYERPYALAGAYVFDRQYDAAVAELRLRLEAMPRNADLLFQLADTLRRKGDFKGFVDAWVQGQDAYGNHPLGVQARRAYDKGGARGFLLWQLHRREAEAKSQYVSPVELASYHAQLGEKGPALALLEEGYRQRATDMRWITEDPAFDFLNPDPQYQSILTRVGEPPPR
jgi:TolB-like protein/DNA-binding winged helix-turn-helix (wHTH) protein